MTARDANELLRWQAELAETQLWTHHVADLDSGQLQTFPLDRPVMPKSRAERLSRLGHGFDPSIFGGPSYELTPNVPYRYSPRAYLVVHNPNIYSAFQSRIWWTPPEREANHVHREIHFTLTVASNRECLVTINLTGKAWPGTVGHVRVMSLSPGFTRTITIDAYVSHTLDLIFTPPNDVAGISLFVEAGVQLLTFDSISLRTLPPSLAPA
jgi:hypothetical protein